MEQSNTQRLDKLAKEVAALTTLMNTRLNAQAALIAQIHSARVTPAVTRAGEPVCVYCHHPRDWHKGGIGNCDHCPCVGFSAAPPAPADLSETDPDFDVCVCHHERMDHHRGEACISSGCGCPSFRPAPEPAPTDRTISQDVVKAIWSIVDRLYVDEDVRIVRDWLEPTT